MTSVLLKGLPALIEWESAAMVLHVGKLMMQQQTEPASLSLSSQPPQQQQQQPQQQLLLLLAATLSQVLFPMPPVCFPSNMEARPTPAAPLLEDFQSLGAQQGLTSLASMCRETGETAMRPLVLSLALQVDLATNLATIMESKQACRELIGSIYWNS